MTALYMDGFDHYGFGGIGRGNMLDGSWAQVGGSGDAGPAIPPWGARTGLFCYDFNGNSAPGFIRYVLPGNRDKLFISFGFSVDGLPSGNLNNQIITFRDGSNAVMACLFLQSTGDIVLTNGDFNTSTILASTQGPVIRSRTWQLLELEFDQGGGNFILRVDDATGTDTPAINANSLSFSNPVAQLGFGGLQGGLTQYTRQYMDDLFIRDDNGSINNSWLGDRRVAALYVNADTATSGWTPSYYHRFGPGILTVGYIVPNSTAVQNNNAAVSTPAASSLDIGNSDFTIETEIRFDKLPDAGGYSSIFSRWDTNNNLRSYRLILGGSSFNNSCLQFDTSTDGTASTISTPVLYPWAPDLNTWYQIAIVRAAGELLLFVDGQQLGLPIADSNTYFNGGSEVMSVGGEMTSTTVVGGTTLAGRMDETRFTNGVGRYTVSFAPPTDAFPRGGSDPYWTSVVWLMGYNSGVLDESSFIRPVSARNGAVSFIPGDGPDVGAFSTVNKANPDDNTFISASLVNASNVLTMTTQPSNTNTVTVGTTDGSTPAVYTFKTAISTAYDVLIDTTAQNTLLNLYNAINAGPGSGTKYGAGTTSNFDVNAVQLPAGQIEAVANVAGTAGNSIASTDSGSATSWATTTLTGGADIPGPTIFRFQRPPNNTTVISALQTNVRALKTDAGSATIQSTFIAPLGGTVDGATHNLATSPDYYSDMVEEDPDTSGPLSPTTIVNGEFQINRTT